MFRHKIPQKDILGKKAEHNKHKPRLTHQTISVRVMVLGQKIVLMYMPIDFCNMLSYMIFDFCCQEQCDFINKDTTLHAGTIKGNANLPCTCTHISLGKHKVSSLPCLNVLPFWCCSMLHIDPEQIY